MKLKNTLLTATALTPILFSACSSDINYLTTANSYIPEDVAFAVKKAEMENSINSLSATQERKSELRQILHSLSETSHGHHIIAGIRPHTQFATSDRIIGLAGYSPSLNKVVLNNGSRTQHMSNRDWYATISHELLHSYQTNHALGLISGISPQQYMFMVKLYEAEAQALEQFPESLWRAGRTIKQLMARDCDDLTWASFYEPTLMEDLKRAGGRGLLTSVGNQKAVQHALDYFDRVYGISFDNDDIARGGLSDRRFPEFKAICDQMQNSGVLEQGNRDFALRQQMAQKFAQYVEYAPSSQAIVNYFSSFAVIDPTHVEEAQILLDSNNPHAMEALTLLITNGAIKGNLDGLKTKTELKKIELNIIKQGVQEAWQMRLIQSQHTR